MSRDIYAKRRSAMVATQIAARGVTDPMVHTAMRTVPREAFVHPVMGTHGCTGLPHLLLGRVAERVVRLALCPVLVTRGPVPGVKGPDRHAPRNLHACLVLTLVGCLTTAPQAQRLLHAASSSHVSQPP